MTDRDRAALREFKGLVQESLESQFVDARVFGSKARGDAREDSDVDVLVTVATDDWRVCDVVYDIATQVFLDTEVCISPKVLSVQDCDRLRRMQAPFITNVMREGLAV